MGTGRFVYPKAAEPLTVAELVQLCSIIDIPRQYIHEKYSIPLPEKGEAIAGRTQEPQPEAEEPKAEPVRNDDRSIIMRLRDFFAGAPQGGATTGTTRTLADAPTLDGRVIQRVGAGERGLDAELFRFFADNYSDAVRKGFERIRNIDTGYTYGVTSSAMLTAMEINLFRFSAAKSLAEVRELNRLFRESENYRDFEQRAAKVCSKFNRDWQRTEYHTALNASLLASTYMRLRKPAKVAPFWKYLTAGDDRVREAHRLLDGVILPFDDERWRKIFPPNGWNCRCTVVSLTRNQAKDVDIAAMRKRVDDFMKLDQWKQSVADGWGVNRARTGEVFTENQFYIKRFTSKENRLLGGLHHDVWGLPSFEQRLEQATREMPQYDGTAEEWYEQHKTLTDYLGRQVEMPEKVFNRHTSKKYAVTRIPLLGCIGEVLSNPDEVWLNDYVDKFKNLNFIKFYDGHVINVICEVTDELKYQITTWFEIYKLPKIKLIKDDPRLKYRRGLLIKK